MSICVDPVFLKSNCTGTPCGYPVGTVNSSGQTMIVGEKEDQPMYITLS